MLEIINELRKQYSKKDISSKVLVKLFETIAKIGISDAAPIFFEEFYSSDPYLSENAIKCAAECPDERMTAHFLKLLPQVKPTIQIHILRALRKLQNPKIIEPLLSLYHNYFSDDTVICETLKVLAEAGPESAKVKNLIFELAEPDNLSLTIRETAIQLLCRYEDSSVKLSEYLFERNPIIQCSALEALGNDYRLRARQTLFKKGSEYIGLHNDVKISLIKSLAMHGKTDRLDNVVSLALQDKSDIRNKAAKLLLNCDMEFLDPLSILLKVLGLLLNEENKLMQSVFIGVIQKMVEKEKSVLRKKISRKINADQSLEESNDFFSFIIRKIQDEIRDVNFLKEESKKKWLGRSSEFDQKVRGIINLLETINDKSLSDKVAGFLKAKTRDDSAFVEISNEIKQSYSRLVKEEREYMENLQALQNLFQIMMDFEGLSVRRLAQELSGINYFRVNINHFVRNSIVLLGRLRDRRAVSFLVKVFEDDLKEYRKFIKDIVIAFGEISIPEAVNYLLPVIKDNSFSMEIKKESLKALRKIGDPMCARELMLIIHSAEETNHEYMTEVIDTLMELSVTDVAKKNLLIEIVSTLNADVDEKVKSKLISTLGVIGTSSTVNLLLQKCMDDSLMIRANSIKALITILENEKVSDTEKISNVMYQIVKLNNPVLSAYCARVLQLLKDDNGIVILQDMIRTKIQNLVTLALTIICEMDSKKIVPIVSEQLFNPNENVAMAALSAILRFKKKEMFEQFVAIVSGVLDTEAIVSDSQVAQRNQDGSELDEMLSNRDFAINKGKLEFEISQKHVKYLTIAFTDIKGYTKKTSQISMLDAMAMLRDHDRMLIPKISKYHGSLIKQIGDALMMKFDDPNNAVRASIEMQEELKRYNRFKTEENRILVRIGMNTGKVFEKDGDVFGDEVNIASRIEGQADPECVLITESTYQAVDKTKFIFEKLEPRQVKGIEQPIQVYKAVQYVGE